jgi:acyl-CoA dehydrogenase
MQLVPHAEHVCIEDATAAAVGDRARTALEAGTVGGTASCSRASRDWKQAAGAAGAAAHRRRAGLPRRPGAKRCAALINDWDITHERADLPPEIWDFLKREASSAMIIPKQYGGLGSPPMRTPACSPSSPVRSISALVHRRRAELARPGRTAAALRHRGAEEPLPAAPGRGEEIPCFALTGPRAGSDATSIPTTASSARAGGRARGASASS